MDAKFAWLQYVFIMDTIQSPDKGAARVVQRDALDKWWEACEKLLLVIPPPEGSK